MFDALRRWVLAFLKVPPEPHPPLGEPASLRVFRAGRNYYKLRLAGWAAAQILALGAFLFWTAILIEVEATVRERKATHLAPPPRNEPKGESGQAAGPESAPSGADARAKNGFERLADGIRSA